MTTSPDGAGFERVREVMNDHVRLHGTGGLAWAVSVSGRVSHGAGGWRNPDEQALPADTAIPAMSKPISWLDADTHGIR